MSWIRLSAKASLVLALTFSAACDKSASNDLAGGKSKDSAGPGKVRPEIEQSNESDEGRADHRPIRELSIATFNVNWGNRDAAATAQIIRDANADLVCIQESQPELERALQRELAPEYSTIMFRGDQGVFPAERFGFLSKHPVRKERYLPARHGIFGAWIIEIEVKADGRPAEPMPYDKRLPPRSLTIQVANVHLEPVRPPEQGELLTILQVFEDTENVHAGEIAWIHEHLSPSLPTIVAGDFNSLSNGAAPAFLRQKGFVDSFADVTESADTRATWRWPTRWIDLAGRIDYIFHSPHFRSVNSRIAERTTSDHSLVVSTLECHGKGEAE